MSSADERSLLAPMVPRPALVAAVAATFVMLLVTRDRAIDDTVGSPHPLAVFALTVALLTATALGHTAVLALAARLRSVWVAVPALLLGALLLPPVTVALRPLTAALLWRALPAMCASLPEYCPPSAWSPLHSLLAGLCLAPFLVVLMQVRRHGAHDERSRVAWVSGALMIAAAGVIPWTGRPAPLAAPLTCAVGLAFMTLAAVETRRRLARLTDWLRDGRAQVGRRSTRGDACLSPLWSPQGFDMQGGVLLVRRASPDPAYRADMRGEALATLPLDHTITLDVLGRRVRWQQRGLVVAGSSTAAIAAVSLAMGWA
ncbi:MAG: hypothetical protein Q8S73_36165 [Deltaproteobacteria bacterium]|nr:hypothetical protein [Myxococcales bacterium]MDP3219594.1 hypothetical protein [Deltaproteobacteria bacterium]